MNYKAARDFILNELRSELSDKLHYHGVHHTLDVMEVVAEICELMEVSAYETILLKTAAAFHDSGFMVNNVNHEELGCHIVREHLPRFGYTNKEIEQICGMIMATKIPQLPKNPLEEVICDADLDYLGRSDFKRIGNTLFQELQAYHILDSETTWNRLQVDFLDAHRFFTAVNQERRAPQKQVHLDALKAIVETYEE